jgi:hypothetical protein
MSRWLAIALLALPSASYAHTGEPVCRSAYIYRLDKGQSEQGGWVSKSGRIKVETRPDMEMQGPFGMTVCSNGDTSIELWKP